VATSLTVREQLSVSIFPREARCAYLLSSFRVARIDATFVDQTEARDAEDQKLRNRSLAIGPLIVCPDGAW